MRTTRKTISELPRATAVQIVCGDCAGYDVLPRKTFLTRDGRCWDCGGRSYALASRLCASLEMTLLLDRMIVEHGPMNEPKTETANEYAN
jgi:hypothetical protein